MSLSTQDIFSYESVRRQLESLVETLPGILSAHPLTEDLAKGFDALLERVETPFTVAVVGQMRVGKSTLLNALVGEDLAVTGVNETTATLNWLKYGGEGLKDMFKVVWRDKPEELLPRERIQEWIGTSEKAKDTRWIEFYSDAEMLKKASFVDTPGMRSVLGTHEDTINEFLANKWDKESQQEGGKADAIVYVFPSTARETDQNRLENFAESRIPGSSPINSIGVIHKWDGINEVDPFSVMQNKAAMLKQVMSGLLCDIIPVSAPLFIAATRFSEHFWEVAATLTRVEDPDDFQDLLSSPSDFTTMRDATIPVPTADRTRLVSDFPLPWSSLRLILQLGYREKPKDAAAFRAIVLQKSGIPHLNAEIEKRFFERSRLIKILTTLARVWSPCRMSSIRLRNEKKRQTYRIKEIPDFLKILDTLIRDEPRLEPELRSLRSFLNEEVATLTHSLTSTSETLRRVDQAILRMEELNKDMDGDLKSLEVLKQQKEGVLPPDITEKLEVLFGKRGADMSSRLGPWRDVASEESIEERLENFLDEISQNRITGELSFALSHAERRIEQLLEFVECRL